MSRGELPDDPLIPGLVALHAHGVPALLERHGIGGASAGSEVLKYHAGLRVTLGVETPDGPLVLKAYSEQPRPLLALLDAFRDAGLADGHAPTVPPVLAVDDELCFMVTPRWQAPSVRTALADGHADRAATLSAQWLREIAARPELAGGPPFAADELLAEARAWGKRPDAAVLAMAEQALRLLDELAAVPPAQRPVRLVHGSFHPSHVFDLGDGPGIIDLDGFSRGPLEADAAMFLGVVSRGAGGRRRLAPAAAPASRRFRDEIAGIVDERALEWYLAVTLVKLAHRLTLRRPSRWHERAAALLAEARDAAAGLAS
jgi:aminoglycoside phosphotransferase (APT) family kinase protein